jgi:hypothetical protein
VSVRDRRLRLGDVAAEGGLPRSPSSAQVTGGAATGFAVAQEPGDRLPALVPAGFGRHREPGLVGEQADDRITHATNGIKFTQLERQRIKRMRYEGSEQTNSEELTAA